MTWTPKSAFKQSPGFAGYGRRRGGPDFSDWGRRVALALAMKSHP